MLPFQIYSLNEKSITVQFELETSEKSLNHVLGFQKALREKLFEGFLEMVSTYTALTVYFDPVAVMRSELTGNSPSEKVSGYLKSIQPNESEIPNTERLMSIPVCYDGDFGLDLIELSTLLNLSIEEIIRLHLSPNYTVYMVGFTPGFPYMGIIEPALECLRKQKPRIQVAPGSVAIAGNQTGIYPFATPGGWQIIGRTPMKLFSLTTSPPALLQQGDKIKFERISKKEFQQMSKV